MKLIVTGRHVEVTDLARQQIDKKLERIERLLNDSAVSAQCVLWQERGTFVCELTVHARGDHMMHGVGRSGRIPTAVSLAVEKVVQQAQKVKGRWKTRRRSGEASTMRVSASEPRIASDAGPRVIRSKRYAVKPLTLDDAMLVLTGGDQSFLVFRHSASDQVAILYRRPDGHFGLIEPEA
jgi:putative sigma-54 modulation protein